MFPLQKMAHAFVMTETLLFTFLVQVPPDVRKLNMLVDKQQMLLWMQCKNNLILIGMNGKESLCL